MAALRATEICHLKLTLAETIIFKMKLLSVSKISLFFAFSLAATAHGTEGTVEITNIETKEISKYVNETLIQVGAQFDSANSSSVLNIRFNGTITPPSKANPELLVASNLEKSMIGFNMRLGVDIYNVYIIDVTSNYIIAFPSLKEIVGTQIQSIDGGLSNDSFILTKIEDHTLTFKYLGKEVSPNYFEFKGSLKDGQLAIDKKHLKEVIQALNL